VLFLFLRLLTHRHHKLATPGFVAGAFVAGYGLARTSAEFFRQPDIQIGYLAGGLTMGMLLSVPMIVIGIATMVIVSRRAGQNAVEKA
jgi:phosphatidylglycerol:prolipoprotein diacylglycerol transferase